MSIPLTLAQELRERIASGTLKSGDPLPSTRVMAQTMGVSRGSVVAAYEELIGEGYLTASRAGTRVNPSLPAAPKPVAATVPQPAVQRSLPLTPGVPDTTLLTSRDWRAAWRQAAAEPQSYPVPGSPRLRAALAEHLRRTRSVVVDPDRLLISAGARDGLRLLLSVIEGPIAVETPGLPMLARVPRELGREVVPTPIDVDKLDDISPAVVLTMPNHQYPMGTQMPAGTRFSLIEWSRKTGAVIVEDDYDSELRQAHPALVALDPGGQVAMLGSFAKTLTPALGLGYLVVPEQVRVDVTARAVPVSGIVQDALANFFEADGVRRHTARMRREYVRRRALFNEVFPDGEPMDGGLHAVLELPDEARVVERARAAGLGVKGLREYWSNSTRSGVVLGLGSAHLREHLETLRGIIDP